jgi:collagenase-like PrtC family protease
MATPFLIDLFHEDEYNAGVMISTIMNVHGLRQVQEIRDRWSKVRRICPSLWMNRDFSWLIKANKIIPLELLANEFCSIGGAECDGLYRQACYLSQNLDTQWNPMKSACIESRKNNQEAWLMARFILPQWVKMYEVETGVKRFKVTGRTHNAEYVKYIGGVYMAGAASGNLLQLWGQLEATLDKEHWKEQQDKAVDQTMLRMEDIEKLLPNFMNCNPNYCGVKCQFCRNALYDIVQCKEREKDAD